MHRILIVEDDKDIQETLEFFLNDNGYKTDKAYNGIEAIDKFEKNKYDLILLDIMIPKIDGYAVCEVIRERSQVPIIMISALTSEETRRYQQFTIFSVSSTAVVIVFMCNRTVIYLFRAAIANIWRFVQSFTSFFFKVLTGLITGWT